VLLIVVDECEWLVDVVLVGWIPFFPFYSQSQSQINYTLCQFLEFIFIILPNASAK
jgi:hypothetical protein